MVELLAGGRAVQADRSRVRSARVPRYVTGGLEGHSELRAALHELEMH